MGTTAQKLNKILETKEAIRTAINNKGGTLTTTDTFASYPSAIDSLPSGGGNTLKTLLDATKSTYSLFYDYKGYGVSDLISYNDTSSVTNMKNMFSSCSNLKEIHMTGMKTNFNISDSTKFTESALVEILNNLATVTSTKTLTMGSTNLAKLTDEEKAIATNKGWTLA